VKLAAAAVCATVVAVAIAIAEAQPNTGPLALAGWLADGIAAHGIPAGAASIGWLGAVVVGALRMFGRFGVTFVSFACAVAALALVALRARALAGDGQPARTAAACAPPLAALCMLDALRPGGGESSWAFAAAVAFVLDGVPSPARLGALAGLTVAWCNAGPEGLLAPALAGAVALGAWLDAPRRDASPDANPGGASPPEHAGAARMRWLAFAVAALGMLCTPATVAYPVAAFEALRLGDVANGIVATVPAVVAPHAYRAGLFVLLILALATGVRERGLRGALPVALAFVLGIASGALVPIFGVVAAPVVAADFRGLRLPPLAAPAVALLAILAIVFVSRGAPRTGTPAHPFELAERAAEEAGPHGTLFCANVDWCDVALANGERVVMDGRLAAAGDAARTTERTVVGLRHGWEAALARSGATGALVANDTSLATLLGMSRDWRGIASDDRATLYERTAR
jgi:hypothetical protein